jgi:hypothetical protein
MNPQVEPNESAIAATTRALWKQASETKTFREELRAERLALLEDMASNAGGASPNLEKLIRLGSRAQQLKDTVEKLNH